jgi:two-component system OmpR family response regulator
MIALRSGKDWPFMSPQPNRTGPLANSNAQRRVLLVDNGFSIRDRLVDYLESSHLHVTAASDLKRALSKFDALQPRLVIVVLEPGWLNASDVLRAIRLRSVNCGIIVLFRGQQDCCEAERVRVLELGADDCISEKVGLRELLARTRAILRGRNPRFAAPGSYRSPRRCRFGGWILDHHTRRLTAPNGCEAVLTRSEHDLLAAFLKAPQRPLTREQLMNATCMHEDKFNRSIDVRVLRLRRKLSIELKAAGVIRTERGVGYVLDLPVERRGKEAEISVLGSVF